jgi:hypothetical protein
MIGICGEVKRQTKQREEATAADVKKRLFSPMYKKTAAAAVFYPTKRKEKL